MSTKKYPAPLYAAAGAGDYAYQQLRKLPARINELRGKVDAREFDVDFDKLRRNARRNAATALKEARTVYATLIARGERVVGRDGTATELAVREPAEVTPAVAPAKPVKRTRPAASK